MKVLCAHLFDEMFDVEKEVATHSSVLAWEIPWTEEPGRLCPRDCKRIRHNLAAKTMPKIFSRVKDIFLPPLLL